MGLNNGVINASSANVRLLSGTVLSKPELQENVPSLAEMLAVFASPLLVDSSLGATYSHEWRHGDANDTFPAPGQPEDIVTSYRFQTYISGWAVDMPMTPGHVYYFIVLATLFVISSICLVHHLCRMGMVTDYTEPQNLFTLAINSPPSQELQVNMSKNKVLCFFFVHETDMVLGRMWPRTKNQRPGCVLPRGLCRDGKSLLL